MGKDKQRTKGGVKPSSSGRTAELLSKNEFGSTFSTAFSPTLTFSGSYDAEDANLSSEIQIIIKKLSKKDSTTKVKALNELIEKCKEDNQICENLLLTWPRIYNKIANDDTRKVRELSHSLMEIIGSSVGRKLAPHLKTSMLFATWFISQNDIFAPASSTAINSFKTIFPNEKKQSEAISYCIDDINQVIIDNLSKRPSVNFSEDNISATKKKEKNAEERNPSFEAIESEPYSFRILYSCLHTMRKLIDLSLINVDIVNEILNDDFFWNLSKNKSVLIRKGFYDLIRAIAENLKDESKLDVLKCSKVFSQSLRNETSTDGLDSLWNCYIVLKLNGFYVDKGKNEHIEIIDIVKKSFNGMATHLAPFILPLISSIDLTIEYSKKLFEAFEEGASNSQSHIQKVAILKSFSEVLGFCLTKFSREDFEGLYNSHVFPFIVNRIKELQGKLYIKEFANLLGIFVKDEYFYKSLPSFEKIEFNEDFARFVVNLCTDNNGKANQANSLLRRKSVKFNDQNQAESKEKSETNNETSNNSKEISPCKKNLLKEIASIGIKEKNCPLLAILSRNLSSNVELYKEIFLPEDFENILILEENIENAEPTLIINIDILKIYPEQPKFLSTFSDLFFNHFNKNIPTFVKILTESNFEDLGHLRKWFRFPNFLEAFQAEILSSNYIDNKVLSFVLKKSENLFGEEQMRNFNKFLIKNCEEINFVKTLSSSILQNIYQNGKTDEYTLELIIKIWNKFIILSLENSNNLPEEVQKLAICSLEKDFVSKAFVLKTIQDSICYCDQLNKLEILIKITIDNILSIFEEDFSFSTKFEPLICFPFLKKKNFCDFLSFLGFFHPEKFNDVTEEEGICDEYFIKKEDTKNIKFHLFLNLYKAKVILALNQISDHLIYEESLISILYLQAICKVWSKFEKSFWQKNLAEEITEDLIITQAKLMEKIVNLDSKKLTNLPTKMLNEYILQQKEDPIWKSHLPLKIFLETSLKMELYVKFDQLLNIDSAEVPVLAREIMENGIEKSLIDKIMGRLQAEREIYAEKFHFETPFRDLPEDGKLFIVSIMLIVNQHLSNILNFGRKTIKDGGEGDDEDGDFYDKEIVSKAACWISAWIAQTKIVYKTNKEQLFWVMLLSKGISLIGKLARSGLISSFTNEYMEFHSANLYLPLYVIFNQLIVKDQQDSFWSKICLQKLCVALSGVPSHTLAFIEPLPSKIVDLFTPLMEDRSEIYFKILSFRILKKVKPYANTNVESDDLTIVPLCINKILTGLSSKILKSNEESNIELWKRSAVEKEDLVTYLLLWDSLLTIQIDSNEFASFVKEENLLPRLLSIIFFILIPPEFNPKSYFDTEPTFDPEIIPSMSHLICTVLQKTLRVLPYTVRWWHNSQLSKQRDKVHVEKFITKHLSAKLAAEELSKVRWDEADNVTVYSHPGCNELVARYKIEETSVTLTITLPLNHPLGPVTVKISDKKLHARITNLLNSRSHSLAAGLKLWKENLDGVYKDVDECAICFFVVHHVTKNLPKMACKMCKHKFHSACLYKWFSTSNKSECPLCRDQF